MWQRLYDFIADRLIGPKICPPNDPKFRRHCGRHRSIVMRYGRYSKDDRCAARRGTSYTYTEWEYECCECDAKWTKER